MSEILYCQGQLAKNPYYYLAGAVNVYSIEELAYFICNNIYSINDSLMNKQLAVWVEEELKLPRLAEILLDAMSGFCTLSSYVACILESSGYCSQEEINRVKTVLDEIGNKNEFFRRKHKADNLLKDNHLSKAINEYEKLLEYYGTRNEPKENVGAVYHNMGTAYVRMFLFQEAAHCFSKAFDLNCNEESLEEYKICLFYMRESGKRITDLELPISNEELQRIGEKIQQTEAELRSDASSDKLLRAQRDKENGHMLEYKEAVESILENWKEECRRAID